MRRGFRIGHRSNAAQYRRHRDGCVQFTAAPRFPLARDSADDLERCDRTGRHRAPNRQYKLVPLQCVIGRELEWRNSAGVCFEERQIGTRIVLVVAPRIFDRRGRDLDTVLKPNPFA